MQGSRHGLHKLALVPSAVGDDVAVVDGQGYNTLLNKLQHDVFCHVAVLPHEPEARASSKGLGDRGVLGLNRLDQLLGLFKGSLTPDLVGNGSHSRHASIRVHKSVEADFD